MATTNTTKSKSTPKAPKVQGLINLLPAGTVQTTAKKPKAKKAEGTFGVPSTVAYAPPSQALVFIRSAKGDTRYHAMTCSRITGLGAMDPTSAVLATATRAMCCKPNPARMAPYAAAAIEADMLAEAQAFTAKNLDPATADGFVLDNVAAAVGLVAGVEAMAKDPSVLAHIAKRTAPAAKAHRPAAAGTARFLVADHPEGYTCRCCGEALPVSKFPTVAGPDVRGTRCRPCRLPRDGGIGEVD
jgi:hypothetical protein